MPRHGGDISGAVCTRRRAIGLLLGMTVALAGADAHAQARSRWRRFLLWRRRLQQRRQWLDGRDAAQDALDRGEIRPLNALIRKFQAEVGGEILDVIFRRVGPHRFYGLKVLTDGGRLRWYVINAVTEEIMTREEARERYR